jgi:hypothetical protein
MEMWSPALRHEDGWASKSPSRGFLRAPQDGLRVATGRPTTKARTLAGAQRRWEEEEGRGGLANGGPWTEDVSRRGTGGGLVGWFGLGAFPT